MYNVCIYVYINNIYYIVCVHIHIHIYIVNYVQSNMDIFYGNIKKIYIYNIDLFHYYAWGIFLL